MASDQLPVAIIGGGPSGLATSHELARRRIEHVVLERGEVPGQTWADLYDSLTLHTGKRMSALPGRPFPRGSPQFIRRGVFLDYLQRYAREFALPVTTRWNVGTVERSNGGWRVSGSGGSVHARAVVFATGIVANPCQPRFPGQERFAGAIIHSVAYRWPNEFLGKRVLVVGVGNSGSEIAAELGTAGVDVTIAIRSGGNVIPLQLLGIPTQYVAFYLRRLPRSTKDRIVELIRKTTELRLGPAVIPPSIHSPLDVIPIIGFNLPIAIRAGRVQVRPGLEQFTTRGVRFTDGREEPFDSVILATGFRAALQPLKAPVRLDERGFALRTDGVRSADQADLYFVGHTYDTTGALHNINKEAGKAAAAIAESLGA